MEGMFESRPDFERNIRRQSVSPEGMPHVEGLRTRLLELLIESEPTLPPGTPPTQGDRIAQLERILSREPQRGPLGELRYLLTSGLAVELITGYEREQHDIDLVVMGEESSFRGSLLGTDNVMAGRYWANMALEAEFLESTAREVMTRRNPLGMIVEVVHPAILMVQKSSNAFGRPPREIDLAEVQALARYWYDEENYNSEWSPIIRHAVNSLPEAERYTSMGRIRAAIHQS
jgi:hypothetical protein